MASAEGEPAPMSGSNPLALGEAAVPRVPLPGGDGLAFKPEPPGRGPRKGSTSTFFIQDEVGERKLRPDYGCNKRTRTIDYRWNRVGNGTRERFGIHNHEPAGKPRASAWQGARWYCPGGRVLLVGGAVLDGISIVRASHPIRCASAVVAAWAGAWMGCKVVGAARAAAV